MTNLLVSLLSLYFPYIFYCILAANLSASVKSRFKTELNSNAFKLSAAIHPRFKFTWIEEEEEGEMKALAKSMLLHYEENQQDAPDTVQGNFLSWWLFAKYSH